MSLVPGRRAHPDGGSEQRYPQDARTEQGEVVDVHWRGWLRARRNAIPTNAASSKVAVVMAVVSSPWVARKAGSVQEKR